MPESKRVRGFLEWLLSHSAWEILKWIGGLTMADSIKRLILAEYHRNPVDWWLLAAVFVVGLCIAVFGLWRDYTKRVVESSSVLIDDPCSKLFTPLQLETFQLAKDIRDYARDRSGLSNEQAVEGYSKRFSERVKSVMLDLRDAGLTDNYRLSRFIEDVVSVSDVQDAARELDLLAIKLSEVTR